MAGPQLSNLPPANPARGLYALTWALAIPACAYIVWSGVTLYRSAKAFAALFASLNVEVPAITGIVVNNYQWFFPALFGGAAALVIGKEFFIRDKWPNIAATCAMAAFVNIFANLITHALYRPIFDLGEKLSH